MKPTIGTRLIANQCVVDVLADAAPSAGVRMDLQHLGVQVLAH
jgi:hypothetical protein